MPAADSPTKTAIVTGASRGFGRAVSTALAAEGWQVVGLARNARDLDVVRTAIGPRFTPVCGDATDERLAAALINEHHPRVVVLNAGATPLTAPLHDQTWEGFSDGWHTDTRHVFEWTKAALREPLAPGSTVIAMSSGAALRGSPLSGGWAGAKAMVAFIASYAAGEAARMGLAVRFVTLYPTMSATGVGLVGVRAYAARQGMSEQQLVAGLEPVLTPELVAEAVLQVCADDAASAAYVLTGSGPEPLAS